MRPRKFIVNDNIINNMMGTEESESQRSQKSKEKKIKKKPVPVMDRVLKVKAKTKEIVINLSMTKYEVISDVAEDLEWRIQYSSRKGDWDVCWTDHMIEPDTLIKMHFFQKISHFPGIFVLARKNLLGLTFMEMRKQFPTQYNFFPRTWLLPAQYPEFRQEVEKGEINCFIAKPEADCQGRGIFLTMKIEEIQNGKHYVIQEYIERPFLVDGLKFDFRVYVLLCGTNPMRLYMYEEGLARFATEAYAAPVKSNLKKLFMHLTNYAINKKNPKYIYNSSAKNMSTGHKRSITSVFKNIADRGFNVESLKQKMHDVLVKTILIGQPLVSHQYKFSQPDDEYRQMCFHILGIDIMIDQLLNPIVLEVNHTPSFATDTPLDYHIKFNLIKDTLNLLNINETTKKQFVNKTNSYQRQRITTVKKLIENEEHRQRIKEAQLKRDEYEDANLGRYCKIYPIADEKRMKEYEEFFTFADKTYFSENNIIRSQIESEKQKQKIGDSSKKNIKKKSVMDSPLKPSPKPSSKGYRSQSERQIEENTTKNSSNEIFKRDAKVSSLLHYHTNQFHSNKIESKTNVISKQPTNEYIKIAKGINEEQGIELPSPPCHRVNFTKNLPKLEQTMVKSTTIQVPRNKYMSLRRKKIAETKQETKKQANKLEPKEKASGSFLTPKVMKFENVDIDNACQKFFSLG